MSLIAIILAAAWVGPAGAAGTAAMVNMPAPVAGGTNISSASDFKLLANGTYTDLNGNTGKPPGRVVYSVNGCYFRAAGTSMGKSGTMYKTARVSRSTRISCSLVK